jgi:ABC-type transport system involved in cytochrome c biogenesis permease subunit
MMQMGNLFEWTLYALNTSAFLYLGACFAYIIGISRSNEKRILTWASRATWLVYLGFVLHTFGLAGRWVIGGIGRPPWTNLYESLVFFAWGIVLAQVYASRKWKLPIIGVVASPLVFILMGMSVMTPNKLVEPLVPALQSYWLQIHVIFGMLAYSGFTLAGCLAFFYLMRRGVSLSKIGSGICLIMLLNLSIAGGKEAFTTGHVYMARTATRTLPSGESVKTKDTYREYEGGPVITRMEQVPYAHIPFWITWALFLVGAGLLWQGRRRESEDLPDAGEELSAEEAVKRGWDLTPAGIWTYRAALVAFVIFCMNIAWAKRLSPNLSLASNPYLTILLVMSFFLALIYLVAKSRYLPFLRSLPTAGRLDELGYKNILFAFPFQTLLLITGAVWAYSAWGRSWGWDPKETWALITWLAYLIYLHGRLLLRWSGVTLSILSIISFVILIFAFLGVNLVLSGLHSYGAA